MTLYTFDQDKYGISTCYDARAANWPPLLAQASAMAEREPAFAEERGRQAFWWVEGGLGCALAGDLPRETLRRLAISAHHGLTET
ncbi:MAG: hypothetical protein ACK40I_12100 [Tabrizicola sp.]